MRGFLLSWVRTCLVLTLIAPSPQLQPFVDGYLQVNDLAGEHRDRPIRTAPRPGGVLTVNLGQPNETANGEVTPRLSLLGIQTCARSWRSHVNAHFVMALLTPAGLARFAPSAGAATVDAILDLRAVVGERTASGLLDGVTFHADGFVRAVDAWLVTRLFDSREKPELVAVRAACAVLERATRVDAAADRLGVSRRHLSRIVARHLGISPKALIDLHRLDRSVRALQRGEAGGIDGFADQAHQVREWRRRLSITPGRYVREGRSRLAEAFDAFADRPAFYL